MFGSAWFSFLSFFLNWPILNIYIVYIILFNNLPHCSWGVKKQKHLGYIFILLYEQARPVNSLTRESPLHSSTKWHSILLKSCVIITLCGSSNHRQNWQWSFCFVRRHYAKTKHGCLFEKFIEKSLKATEVIKLWVVQLLTEVSWQTMLALLANS